MIQSSRKTNILEAAFLSGTTKSHKGSKDKEMIRFGYEEAHIRTIVEKNEKEYQIDMHLKKNSKKLNDFLVENNIHSVGLCYCVYDEDKHITVNNNILTEFLQKFFIRYFYGNHKLNVREFESVIKKSLGAPSKLCTFAMRHSCGNYFSIRPNGDVQFCDPFTLGKPAVGNILTETFNDIKNKPDVLSMINRARIGVRNTCDQCEIRNICGGGCFRHTIDDGSNVFCETFKAVYPYIEKIIHAYKEKDNPGCIHPSRLVNLSFKTFDDEDGHKIGVQEDINIDTGEIRQIYKDFDSGEIDYVGY